MEQPGTKQIGQAVMIMTCITRCLVGFSGVIINILTEVVIVFFRQMVGYYLD
jgi:hypothetical protein